MDDVQTKRILIEANMLVYRRKKVDSICSIGGKCMLAIGTTVFHYITPHS